jgi:hypothetical protein
MSNEIYNGIKTVRGSAYNPEQYDWVLVSIADKQHLFSATSNATRKFIISLSLSVLMAFAILVALYFVRLSQKMADDHTEP